MYSIICCSVKPEAAEALRQNVADTIGVPFEFIVFDNREKGYGLCRVYNLCAARARYDLLCFVHEDVAFQTPGWGQLLAGKLREESCGVIGFAGSIVKLKRLTGWNTCGRDLRLHYVQFMRGGHHLRQVNPDKEDFSPVVTLDGLCLFVRRQVWEEIPFDDATFTGFHAYDVDFSLAVACRYTNYVCHTVLVEHFSEGSFSYAWLDGMKKLHAKWESRLPMVAVPMTPEELARYDLCGEAYFMKFMWQKGCFDVLGIKDACNFWKRHPGHGVSWLLFPKYLKYKLRYLKGR